MCILYFRGWSWTSMETEWPTPGISYIYLLHFSQYSCDIKSTGKIWKTEKNKKNVNIKKVKYNETDMKSYKNKCKYSERNYLMCLVKHKDYIGRVLCIDRR